MSSHRYVKSTNPFADDDDVDDETFLRNSRRSNPQPTFEDQLQSFQERKRTIEERTINSTEKSLSVLRESEQIGIATAEELLRQREKLEKTDKQLDEINATLRFSQKHINGIKSVFSSLKSYMSGRNDASPNSPNTQKTAQSPDASFHKEFEEKLSSIDRFDSHPSTRLKNLNYDPPSQSSGSKDFSAKLDANLQEMCSNITKLKGLATDLSQEIDSQNDLITNITDKAEVADLTISKQNKDMLRLLKK